MAKKDYGLVVGKCEICTINLWDTSGGEPAIWPCNIKDWPYETHQEQHAHLRIKHGGEMGSGLGQIDFQERVLRCDDCSYNDKGQLTHVCGPCEEKAIRERISWWQKGKKLLNERGEYILVGDKRRK